MTSENESDTTSDNNAPETKNTENKKAENKRIFGPLGTYAAIAVIMVSLIVTTAIMLNKELDTVDQQIASIEDEVSNMNMDTDNTVENVPDESSTEITTVETEEITTEVATDTDTQNVTTTGAVTETKLEDTSKTTEAQPESMKLSAIETPASTQATEDSEAVSAKDSESKDIDHEARKTQFIADNKARLKNRKVEQKQRMSEMFARIEKLEQQQLEQYKASQDKRIEQLRQQNTYQQQIIDALISRSEESVKMREASLLKKHNNREQMLNRI